MSSTLLTYPRPSMTRRAAWILVFAALTAGCAANPGPASDGMSESGFVDMNMDRSGGGSGGSGGSCR